MERISATALGTSRSYYTQIDREDFQLAAETGSVKETPTLPTHPYITVLDRYFHMYSVARRRVGVMGE